MLTDDQLIDELRIVLEAESDGIDPRPGLLDRVHQELKAIPARRRPLRRTLPAGSLPIALTVAVAVAVAVLALVLVRHGTDSNSIPATPPPAVGTAQIAATAADPSGGRAWGLRTVQTQRLEACLQIGRLQAGKIGAVGQDGAFENDGHFHPIPLHENFPCGQTDARGYLFLNVFEREIPASAALGAAAGCYVGQPAPGIPRQPHRLGGCSVRDLRNVAYGVLGPDAVSITYNINHHLVTERTGPDGAYLVVLPATQQSCTSLAKGGKSCEEGSGEVTTPNLQSGVITAVTYRDGHVCRLSTPTATSVGAGSCPNVGYTHYPPFHPPHVAASQVAAPLTVHHYVANRFCYRSEKHVLIPPEIPCDHGVPRGYTIGNTNRSLLIDISFTAPLAATNQHSVYEWSLGLARSPSCAVGGGMSATTMSPIRAGQHVVLQNYESPCPGTYNGLVTYQPNGWPGHDTLGWQAPIRDHSTVVGRFTFVVR